MSQAQIVNGRVYYWGGKVVNLTCMKDYPRELLMECLKDMKDQVRKLETHLKEGEELSPQRVRTRPPPMQCGNGYKSLEDKSVDSKIKLWMECELGLKSQREKYHFSVRCIKFVKNDRDRLVRVLSTPFSFCDETAFDMTSV